MNRMLRTFLASAALCGAASAFAGCADNESTLFIQGVLHSKPPQCTVTADPGQEEIGHGTLDVALRTNYQAALLVGNQYAPRGNKQQLRTETTRVVLTGAEITLTDGATGAVFDCPTQANCGKYSVYGSGFTDSSKSDDPGWGVIFAQLVPNAVGEAIAADKTSPVHTLGETVSLVATIKVFGRTLGGQDVESGNYSFPVDVCEGCLIDYSHADFVLHTCTPTQGFEPDKLCAFGQDDGVDCRACSVLPICNTIPQ